MQHSNTPSPDMTVPNPAVPTGHSTAFDWTMVLLSAWFLGGAYVDGWAHTHGKVDSSFFTPWHALFYSGYLAVAIYLVGHVIRQVARGISWRQALPPGYGWSLAGALLFWFGGVGDLIWHTLFGIEEDVEALFSPTHLTLAAAMWLIVGGPFRAAWQRSTDSRTGVMPQLPMLISAAFMLSVITFILQIAHPMSTHWIGGNMPSGRVWLYQEMGVMTFLWSAQRPRALRIFAFVLPVVATATYVFAVDLSTGLWWSVHPWAGVMVLTGGVGVLCSYLLVRPPLAPSI